MVKEFRNFALHGSLLDMAIGFIMGAAFSQVVSALVKDILMPPVGLLLGPKAYATLADAQKASAPIIAYGDFLNGVISFLIVAIVMFVIVRQVNRLRPPAPAPKPTKECPHCLSTIALGASRCPNCTSELAAS
jgi:large conductance mechanosensitive channel